MQRGSHAAVFTVIIPSISVTIAIATEPSVEQLAPKPCVTIQPIANCKHLSVGEACWGRTGKLSWEQIDEAHRMRDAGDLHGAIIQWEHLAESLSELDPEAACAALENLAICKWERGDSKSAIASYKRILIEFRSGGLNKAHDACRALSDLYIQEGNLQSALKYAEVANVAFPYKSMCGLESIYFQDAVDRRIEELRSAIEYQTPVKLK